MKFDNYMILDFPSKSSNEAFARSAVACFAAQMDPTMEELADIKTAVSEAVTNAIIHGYENMYGYGKHGDNVPAYETIHPGKVYMHCEIKGDVFYIVIQDKGRGIVDVEKAMEPLFTTGGEERSGLGFSVMESFTDRLRVKSAPDKGTTVTMEKYIAPRVKGR